MSFLTRISLSFLPGGPVISAILGIFSAVLRSFVSLATNGEGWLALGIMLGGVFLYGDLHGRHVEAAKWQAAVKAEKAREARVSADAARDAAKRIADLQERAASLEKLLKENANAAAKAPGADSPALDADSVRRLNRVHGRH